jgi:predicted RNA methylase
MLKTMDKIGVYNGPVIVMQQVKAYVKDKAARILDAAAGTGRLGIQVISKQNPNSS